MLMSLLALSTIAAPQAITLSRVNKAGETQKYQVRSHLIIENKVIGSDTFVPEDLDIDYDFALAVSKEKADGFVDARYTRPTMTITEGENADRGSKKTIEKANWDLSLVLSPVNKIIDVKDNAPKKPEKKSGGLNVIGRIPGIKPVQESILTSFVGELQRLSLFIGSLESCMDFQPKLPIFEVTKGETWKETVSYAPQKLKSKNNKTVMQRMDYTYTYEGVVESAGVKVHRISAKLVINADMTQFLKDNVDSDVLGSLGLKEISYKLDANVNYDVDMKTMRTLKGVGESKGGFKIVVSQYPEDPIVEQRLTGKTTLKMITK